MSTDILNGADIQDVVEFLDCYRTDMDRPYRPHFVQMVKAVRNAKDPNMTLNKTLRFIASEFGFEDDPQGDGLNSWRAFSQWAQALEISFKNVQGIHALTLLKAMAIQRNVSVQPK